MREAEELLFSAVHKSGGIEKWHELLEGMRRVCRARDRDGIASFVRNSAKTEAGAVQLAMLALLGLSLGEVVYAQIAARVSEEGEKR